MLEVFRLCNGEGCTDGATNHYSIPTHLTDSEVSDRSSPMAGIIIMKQYAIQTQKSPKDSCALASGTAIPLKKLIQQDHKVCRLKKLINWSFLDNELGYLFKDKQAPPPRLIIGLLYLQSIDDLPYSDVIDIWQKSPEWQYFCGQEFLNEKLPLHGASLSIWSRVVGSQGRASMTRALGNVQHNVTLH